VIVGAVAQPANRQSGGELGMTVGVDAAARADRYRWIALTNTPLGVLMVTINSSIVLISLPAIFRGVHLDVGGLT
jgi:hypothetical protein